MYGRVFTFIYFVTLDSVTKYISQFVMYGRVVTFIYFVMYGRVFTFIYFATLDSITSNKQGIISDTITKNFWS